MKNVAKKLASAMVASSALAGKAFAQAGTGIFTGQPTGPVAAATGTLGQNVVTILNYFLGFLGIIAVIFLIYAGVLMVTAGGAEEQVTKARKIITYAVIGIVVVILSFTIVQWVSMAL